jgi:hypothetical protein
VKEILKHFASRDIVVSTANGLHGGRSGGSTSVGASELFLLKNTQMIVAPNRYPIQRVVGLSGRGAALATNLNQPATALSCIILLFQYKLKLLYPVFNKN